VITTTADGHRVEATAIWSWRVARDVAVQHLVDDDGWSSPRKSAEIQWAVESILSHHNVDALHWSNQDLQLELARAIEGQLSSDNAWLQTFGFKRLTVIRTSDPP
ncbi:MAG: hypothetical protein AAB393_17220, partial [Bacteroidota bacterium]